MIDTRAQDESDVSCLSEDFEDRDEFEDEAADDQNQLEELNLDNFKSLMPNNPSWLMSTEGPNAINQLCDLADPKFDKAASEFMLAIGEDNIFMSGLDWLQSENFDKRQT